MEIATVNTARLSTAKSESAGVPTPAASETSGRAAISSDFETFLKMLTVQMQNQDPMNPIESSDYAVQLATFSGVEQQVKTNDLLSAVSAQLGAMSMSDLAGWVGMEARAVAPGWLDDQPITIVPDPVSGAEEAYLVVRDSSGNQVDRIQVPISDAPLTWTGFDALGEPFPEGEYSFFLQNYSQGELLAEDQVAVYSEIVEARSEKGETVLVLKGGHEVSAGDVGALRSPAPAGA